ncbi:DegT/DnrJ/EryC1/StrS family aminotransferase [Paenibacillus antri]|uniref:DegT/DnrJ/EryC1/StrS family aminotransferase n=1 Tax=Paenibacillus antri TaxID=2582848 RepID=A0A5R9GLC8_9BACL|nr:DegT/DnrJ/EryC1/StrS family aminotransferase [Paenibacillus antri]TLS52585.1 DegT/DnrJ/EryC1/StrS family aminotransferase [Paenibacillus antri]
MNRLAIDGGTPVRTAPFPTWPVHGEEEERYVLEVVRSGKWGGTAGKVKLLELEETFAAMHGAKHAITTVNGTLGLTVALQAVGVGPGDEVIMPPYTFIATASSALMFGAIPVFVDVEPDTLLLDPEKAEAAITPRTKAIVAVHLAGMPADMGRLREIAGRRGLRLIEDAAQGVGAKRGGLAVGAIGDIGSFSFQMGKNVTAGEGGILLTNDDAVADLAWSLTNVGRVRSGAWYQHEHIGWNLRMTELQAAVALGQLSRFEPQFARRERNAALLNELLAPIEGIRLVRRPADVSHHAQHLYVFFLDDGIASESNKAEALRRLQAEGIPAAAGYVSLNRNRAVAADIRKWTGGEGPTQVCPVSERASAERALWLHQNVLLAEERDMYDIRDAVAKVVATLG